MTQHKSSAAVLVPTYTRDSTNSMEKPSPSRSLNSARYKAKSKSTSSTTKLTPSEPSLTLTSSAPSKYS